MAKEEQFATAVGEPIPDHQHTSSKRSQVPLLGRRPQTRNACDPKQR